MAADHINRSDPLRLGKGTFPVRAHRGIYLGMDRVSRKGVRILKLPEKTLLIRDRLTTTFNETKFPMRAPRPVSQMEQLMTDRKSVV